GLPELALRGLAARVRPLRVRRRLGGRDPRRLARLLVGRRLRRGRAREAFAAAPVRRCGRRRRRGRDGQRGRGALVPRRRLRPDAADDPLHRQAADGRRARAAEAAGGVVVHARRPRLLLMELRGLTDEERDWVEQVMVERWKAPTVVSRGRVHRPRELAGLVVLDGERRVGLLTYRVEGDSCEVVTLDALVEGAGVGTMLLD